MKEFLVALLRGRGVIIACVAGGILAALLVNLFSPPRYRAETTVKISTGEGTLSLFADLPGAPSSVDPVQSQIEIIKSRGIARSAVTGLGLNIRVKAGNPEVKVLASGSGADAAPGKYRLSIRGDTAALIDGKTTPIASCQRGDTLSGPGFWLVLDWKRETGDFTVVVEEPDRVADRLRGSYSAVQKGRTDLVRISCTSPKPELSRDIVNALAAGYVEYSLMTVREQARAAREFIEGQVSEIKIELTAAEDSLRLFKESEGIFELSESAQNLIDRLSQLDQALAEARTGIRINSGRISALKKQVGDTSAFFGQYRAIASDPDMASNPQLAALSRRMDEIAEKRASLLAELSPSHPEVVALDQEAERLRVDMARVAGQALASGPSATDPLLQNVYAQLVQAQVDLESSQAQERAVSRLIAEREELLKTFPGKEQRLAELTRRVEADRKIYGVLLERLQEAKIEEARQVSDARVVDLAMTPQKPVSPRKGLNLFLGLLLGLLVGVGLAYGLEQMNTTIRSPQDTEAVDHDACFLGAVPALDHGDEDILRDAVYTVSMNMLYHSRGEGQAFLVTSPEPEAGKSFLTSQCAMTLAEMGKRVLVIDADMRKPQQHRIFGLEERGEGLSDLLYRRRTAASVVKKLGESLFLVTSGERTGLSAGALASGSFREIIGWAMGEYDVVLVDAPPVALGAVDTLEMVSATPWTVMVVRFGRTDRNLLAEALKRVRARGGRLLGFVLNFLDLSEARYGYGYNYYHYYHYGSRKGNRKSVPRRILYWLGFTRR